ncbi:MAG: glycolate oxidase subunit GlcE [Betaproteobacteria bacterium]
MSENTNPLLGHFRDQIISASSQNQKINISGGSTKNWLGDISHGEILSTTKYAGILDYDPEELVITVCSGTSLKEVEEALEQKNQYFPFDPPHFGSSATVGGMIAAGLAGPGRGIYGGLRDYVLGAKIMDGRGDILSFGGKVIKNVAGYDVSRLMPGSLGTLSLLLDVSIKVLPKPVSTQTLTFEMSQEKAIQQMNYWASQPLSLSATTWVGDNIHGTLWIRLAGAKAAIQSSQDKMINEFGGQLIDSKEAQIFWQSIKEQTHTFFPKETTEDLWRFSINPISPPFNLQGKFCMEWLGGQRWYKGELTIEQAQALAAKHGGHATLFKGSKRPHHSVFTSLEQNALTAPLKQVQDRLRLAFDPHHVFQTGRMP